MSALPAAKDHEERTVAAAGAIVWRRGVLGPRVALVRRGRHRLPDGRAEWTLPKGHPNDGEPLEQAALRETEEETGWRVLLGAPAGHVEYPIRVGPDDAHPEDAGARLKVVHFWHAEAVARYRPRWQRSRGDEVERVRWRSPRRAVGLLSYPEQAHLLAEHAAPPRGAGPPRWRIGDHWRWDRLHQALALQRARPMPTKAEALLATADDAMRRGDINGAWEGLFAAQEEEILGWNDREVTTRAAELLIEAEDKLAGHWRGRVIGDLLGWVRTPDDEGSTAPALEEKRATLSRATRLRNERSANQYRDLDRLREQLVLLGAVGALICVALVALLLTETIPFVTEGEPTADQVLGVALFGALGGAFSGAISLIRAQPRRIPQALAQGWTTLMRPVIGAAGALAAFAFLGAGVLGIDGGAATYAVAFAAGFSERLVSKAAEGLGG